MGYDEDLHRQSSNEHEEDEDILIKLSPWMEGFIYGISAGIIGSIIGVFIFNHLH